MNKVIIKLNPYQSVNTISINERPLSVYSKLNNYMNEPLLTWADSLHTLLENELNDQYELTIIGEVFEQLFIKTLSKEQDCCVDVKVEAFAIRYPVNERLQKINSLYEKYTGKSILMKNIQAASCLSVPTSIQCLELVSSKDAFVILCEKGQNIQSYINKEQYQIVLVKDVEEKINIQGKTIYWNVTNEKYDAILCYIVERFSLVESIKDASVILQNYSLTKEEKDILNSALAIDAYVNVNVPDRIEETSIIVPEITYYPENINKPAITIKSLNTDIIDIQDGTLVALRPGTTKVEFYYSDANLAFYTAEIEVYKEYLIKQLSLSVEKSTMGVGLTQTIQLEYQPKDAQDVNEIQWTVEPPIAQVNKQNEIVALQPGKCVIKAKTTKYEAALNLTILSQVEHVIVKPNEVECFVGERVSLSYSIYPENCYDKEIEWLSSNEKVAIIETNELQQPVLKATGFGECTITCKSKTTTVMDQCHVFVRSRFNEQKDNSKGLAFVAIGIVLAVALGIFFLFGAGEIFNSNKEEKPISLAEQYPNATQIDVFEEIELKLTGISGDGVLEIINESREPFVQGCTFHPAKYMSLFNGEEVTISVHFDKSLIEKYNVIPLETEKKIIVSGLYDGLKSASNINMEQFSIFRDKVIKEANKTVEDDEYFTYSDYKYEGAYLQTTNYVDDTKLVIIVSQTRYYNGKKDEASYLPLSFNEVSVDESGSFTNDPSNYSCYVSYSSFESVVDSLYGNSKYITEEIEIIE